MAFEFEFNEKKLIYSRITQLLQTPTFDDIIFNCKDGQVNGNRLVLAIYSNFLEEIFHRNPLITCHPLGDNSDTGINLPEIPMKDVEVLLKLLNADVPLQLKMATLKGLLLVAKQLKIELNIIRKDKKFATVYAVPVTAEMRDDDEEDEEKVNCKDDEAEEEDDDDDEEKMKMASNDCLDENEKQTIEKNNVKKTVKTRTAIKRKLSDRQTKSGKLSSMKAEKVKQNASEVPADLVCPVCKITCKTSNGVRVHIGHAHRNNEQADDEDDKKRPVCKCGQTFSVSARKLFRDHREKCPAFRKEAFICELCESPFISMPALSNHLVAIHGISKERKSCICGETFGSMGSCRKHEITCEAYRAAAIFCKDCDLPFLTKGHLKQHLQSYSHRNITTVITE